MQALAESEALACCCAAVHTLQLEHLYPRWNGSAETGAELHPNATNPGSHYWGKPWLAAAAALTDYMFTCPSKRAAATLAVGNRSLSSRDTAHSVAGAPTTGSSGSGGSGSGGSGNLSSHRPPVFLYYFSHQPTDFSMRFGSVFSAATNANGIPSYGRGACHGCELRWVWYDAAKFHTPEEYRLADIMTQYWINFAATGDPNRAADGRKYAHASHAAT